MPTKQTTRRPKAKKYRSLTSVTVTGFKALCLETTIDLRPLTILAGANSSGKSSALQPLLLLKQTLEDRGDPGPLLLYGENARFTAVDQMVSKCANEDGVDGFSLALERSDDTSLGISYCRHKRGGLDIAKFTFHGQGDDVELHPHMDEKEVLAALPAGLKDYTESFKAQRGNEKVRWDVERSGPFLGFVLNFGDAKRNSAHSRLGTMYTPARLFTDDLLSIIHVPGLRASPERFYRKASSGPLYPGTFDQYAASIIYRWQESNDKRLATLLKWLVNLGLTSAVNANPIEDASIELKVGRLPASTNKGSSEDLVSIADVGFGVSQVLPILVALLSAEPGRLVYIEQPELHLHPRAQRALAEPIAWAAKHGVLTVIETHSSILVKALRTAVASKKLSADDTILHWFTRDQDGYTRLTSTPLPTKGDVELPEDFTDVEVDVERKLFRALTFGK